MKCQDLSSEDQNDSFKFEQEGGGMYMFVLVPFYMIRFLNLFSKYLKHSSLNFKAQKKSSGSGLCSS